MTVSIGASNPFYKGVAQSASTTIAVTYAAGSALIVLVNHANPSTTSSMGTVSSSVANGSGATAFTHDASGVDGNIGGTHYGIDVFSLFNMTGTSATLTVTPTTSEYMDIFVYELIGAPSTGSYESAVTHQVISGSGATSLADTASAALSTPTNEIAFSLCCPDFNNSAATTSSTGWTVDKSVASVAGAGGYGIAHQIYTAGGSITPAVTWTFASDQSQAVVAYQGTAGGATDPFPLIYCIPSPTVIRL